ncbi:hypothetical protein DH2020_029950 [Rehmannia glutinosa]|uniref:Alpha-taxilin n=1 Tax=Rehmannia glutinosa TaxID=99300 RepID=A0ABR0VQ10_REHGL
MENPNLNPNPEVNQLPEADSLPDGFVESSSAAPLEEAVNDYKEEKLLELGSRPEVVIEDEGSSSDKLVENVGDQSQSAVGAGSGEGNVKNKSVERAELQTVASEVISVAGTAENNKKDECKRVSTEGQNLRLDLSDKFQDAITTKLKQLVDQYTLSEQQHAQQLKQKTLELQLADLRLQQHEEKLKQEQSQMKLYAEQVAQLLATEKNLRLQLTADGEKFQQFQEALVKSNEVFETFKQEIEKRERLKKQLEKTRNQKEKLESLCRSLQAERKTNPVGGNSSDSIPV